MSCWIRLTDDQKDECFDSRAKPKRELTVKWRRGVSYAWVTRGPLLEEWKTVLPQLFAPSSEYEELNFRKQLFGSQSQHAIAPLPRWAFFLVGPSTQPRASELDPVVVVQHKDLAIAQKACKLHEALQKGTLASRLYGYRFHPEQKTNRICGREQEEHLEDDQQNNDLDTAPRPAELQTSRQSEPTSDHQISLCGLPVRINLPPTSVSTYATIGGCVEINGQRYGLTVAHTLLGPNAASVRETDMGLDWEVPSIRDSVGYVRTIFENVFVYDPNSASNSKIQLNEGTNFLRGLPIIPIEFDREQGWALVPVQNDIFRGENRIDLGNGQSLTVNGVTDQAPEGPVFIPSGVSPPSATKMSASPSAILLPGLDTPSMVWVAERISVRGDCGSWVVDEKGRAFGMVIAASEPDDDGLHETYCLSLSTIFASIEARLGDRPRLPVAEKPARAGSELVDLTAHPTWRESLNDDVQSGSVTPTDMANGHESVKQVGLGAAALAHLYQVAQEAVEARHVEVASATPEQAAPVPAGHNRPTARVNNPYLAERRWTTISEANRLTENIGLGTHESRPEAAEPPDVSTLSIDASSEASTSGPDHVDVQAEPTQEARAIGTGFTPTRVARRRTSIVGSPVKGEWDVVSSRSRSRSRSRVRLHRQDTLVSQKPVSLESRGRRLQKAPSKDPVFYTPRETAQDIPRTSSPKPSDVPILKDQPAPDGYRRHHSYYDDEPATTPAAALWSQPPLPVSRMIAAEAYSRGEVDETEAAVAGAMEEARRRELRKRHRQLSRVFDRNYIDERSLDYMGVRWQYHDEAQREVEVLQDLNEETEKHLRARTVEQQNLKQGTAAEHPVGYRVVESYDYGYQPTHPPARPQRMQSDMHRAEQGQSYLPPPLEQASDSAGQYAYSLPPREPNVHERTQPHVPPRREPSVDDVLSNLYRERTIREQSDHLDREFETMVMDLLWKSGSSLNIYDVIVGEHTRKERIKRKYEMLHRTPSATPRRSDSRSRYSEYGDREGLRANGMLMIEDVKDDTQLNELLRPIDWARPSRSATWRSPSRERINTTMMVPA